MNTSSPMGSHTQNPETKAISLKSQIELSELVTDLKEAWLNCCFSMGRAFQDKHLVGDMPSEDAMIFAAGDAEDLAFVANRLLEAIEKSSKQ